MKRFLKLKWLAAALVLVLITGTIGSTLNSKPPARSFAGYINADENVQISCEENSRIPIGTVRVRLASGSTISATFPCMPQDREETYNDNLIRVRLIQYKKAKGSPYEHSCIKVSGSYHDGIPVIEKVE